ncbi:MAG: acyl carrier protein [Candidatus Sericytochromatia bacterium]
MSANAAELKSWLITQIAQELNTAPDDIDPDQPFAQLGLDSTAALALSGDLEDLLGRPLEPAVMFEYPTITKLTAHLCPDA